MTPSVAPGRIGMTLLLLVALGPQDRAAAQAAQERASALLRQADEAIGRETPSSARDAIQFARQALTLVGVRGNTAPSPRAAPFTRLVAGRGFLFIGLGHRILGQLDSTRFYAGLALPLARGVDDPSAESLALLELGMAFAGQGQLDTALTLVAQAQALADTRLSAAEQVPLLLKFGALMGRAGQADSARALLRRGAALAASQGNAAAFAHAHRFLAGGYVEAAQFDSALAHYRVAQQVLARLGDAASLSTVHSGLSTLFHQLNLLDSALAYSAAAIPVQESRGMQPAVLSSYRARGIIFSRLRLYDSATANHARALRVAQLLGAAHEVGMIESDLALGFAATQPDSALVHARRALGAGGGNSAAATAFPHFAMAAAFLRLGQPDSALVHARAPLFLPRQEMSPELVFQALGIYAILSFTTGRLEAATTYADSAAAVRAGIGRSTAADMFRVAFGDGDAALYRMWTSAWVARAATEGEAALYAALAVSERGRSQALLDLMTDSVRVVAPGADLVAEGRRLAADATRSAELVMSYEMYEDGFRIWVLRRGGAVQVESVEFPPDSLATLVADYRFGLGVASASRTVARGNADLERGVLPARPSAAWRTAGRRLRDLLLPESVAALIGQARQVTIIPAGVIGVVPFAALPDRRGDGVLSDAAAIRYAPSIAVLLAAEARTAPAQAPVVVVSNPTMPMVRGADGAPLQLEALPGAEAEGVEVARRLGAAAHRGIGATEGRVRSLLPQARLVHIASHGYAYASEAMARSSFVALAPDSVHDGLLTVEEILQDPALQLVADLVILSACQTGLGNVRESEGTIGLQRAFLARGARAVLVSLWNVSDDATRLLMDRFYAHWLDDPDRPGKAEALRRAQEDVRRRPEFSAPRYWAAFQLVGAG